MRWAYRVLCLFIICSVHYAEQPNWSNGIARIVYDKCSSCHRDGGIAPFPMTEYQQVFERKQSVLTAISSRQMPPYPADTKYRTYSHQKDLSEEQLADMISWISAGAPIGDINAIPNPPLFTGDNHLSNPDYRSTMPTYTSKAEMGGKDEYRCFVLDGTAKNDEYISALEVIPGNIGIVHHVLIFQDTSSVPLTLDNATPEPGYEGFGGIGSNTAELVGVYAPGNEPYYFPKGFGVKFHKNARIIIQVHYPAGSAGQQDSTQVRFLYSKESNTREVLIDPLLNHKNILDGPFRIPANQVKTFHQRFNVPVDASLIAVMPHMHLLGKSTKIAVRTPLNDTIPIISIPQWDFHWQMAYTFTTLQKIPKGSVLESAVMYDNTTDNHHNPSDPPILVTVGEGTKDEMMLTYFYYALYKQGDEFITIGINDKESPHPMDDSFSLNCIEVGKDILVQFPNDFQVHSLLVSDITGKMVYTLPEHLGHHTHAETMIIPGLNRGFYVVQARDIHGKTVFGSIAKIQ